MRLLRLVLQLFIGLILFGSALGKALDLPGFVGVLKTYQAFPDLLLWPLALMVTGFEFVLGAWVLSGRRLATATLVAMGLNAGYAVWMTITLLRGLELPNCGCFGVFFPQPLRWYSPLENIVLMGMCGTLWWTASRGEDERWMNWWSLGIVSAVILGALGAGAWFHMRYDASPDQMVSLRFFTPEDYPDNPERLSRTFGTHRHGRLRIHQMNGTRFRFVLEPASAQSTSIELDDVDLAHLVAAVPTWLPKDSHLVKIGLIDREWNRQQVSFRRDSPHLRIHAGGDGFEAGAISRVDLARNCLNAGLWEILLFTREDGEERLYDHVWFTFPLGLYKQLFEQTTGLSYWDYWWSLEHWVDPSDTPVPLDRLRRVVDEWPVQAKILWDDAPLWRGEQQAKRKNVLAQPVAAYRDWYTKPVQFASFVQPGVYSRAYPHDTQLHRLAEFTGAKLRQVRLPGATAPLAEIELSFKDNRTGEQGRLIFGGLSLRALPKLRTADYDRGWQVPMGIGNPSFFESYEEVLTHPPRQRTFYGFHLDEQDRWVDHHAVGVDGPLLHRDANNPSVIHLYLLSYERHALLNHFVIECPAKSDKASGCS